MTLSACLQDVRYALRLLKKSPVFTIVAVASLALGLGANTAIFTLADAIMLRWLPVPNPQELVVLARNPTRPSTSFSYPDYRYVRDHGKSYTGVIAFSGGGRPTSFQDPGRGGASQLVALSLVSGNYFEVLGVRPAVGRLFNPADNETEGARPYVVLSHGFWQRAFGGETGVVGRDIRLNGRGFTVIGVSGGGFTGATVGVSPDVFVPIVMFRAFNPAADGWNTRHWWWLTAMGRLKTGVSLANAEAEFKVLWQQILDTDPERRPAAAWNKDDKLFRTALVLPGSRGQSYLRTEASKPITVLLIAVGLVLAIACANIANLLLARGAARKKEIAVRLAVGAGRSRLVRQMLVESLVLSLLGGLASLIVAWLGVRVLLTFLPTGTFPVELNLSADHRVLGFAFTLSVVTGLAFGLVPALRASRPDLVEELKSEVSMSGSGKSLRWDLRRTLVAFQVALSLLLLAGAGLFVRTLSNLRDQEPGMNRENLLLVETTIGQLGYQPQRERTFHDRLRSEVQRLPGVKAAAVASITPLSGSRWNGDVTVEGYTWKPDEPPYVDMNSVTPRYFEAAGIPIVLGRDFADSDNLAVLPDRLSPPPPPRTEPPPLPGPPRVVIVNEAFARKFFGASSAIGRRLCVGDKWDAARVCEIVGVVRDARYFDLKKPVEPMLYQPSYREREGGGDNLCVRTTTEPPDGMVAIRGIIQQIDPAVSVTEIRTMEDNLAQNLIQERFVAMLGGFFGIVALLLASVGLYGVMSQAVAKRTREIGIRMALGAEGRRVLWLVMRDALLMVVAGAAVGIPAVLAVTRYAEAMLFGVKPQDPATIASSLLVLVFVTAVAAFVPARRATQVHPMEALRQD
jgi:predicted permease